MCVALTEILRTASVVARRYRLDSYLAAIAAAPYIDLTKD